MTDQVTGAKSKHAGFLKLGTDHLWFGVIFIAAITYVSLFPLGPNDFWWHLKIGQIISETGKIPNTNMFAWTLSPDTPYLYGTWLGEYLLYFFYRLGSIELVTFIRNFVTGLTFFLLGLETKRRTGSWRLAALALGLVALMTLNNLVIRPQMWAWLPFVLYFIILGMFTDKQMQAGWLFVIPVLMIAWVNLHGSFIVGCIMVGTFFIGEVIRTLTNSKNALSWKQNGLLLLILILTFMAVLINPLGFGIKEFVIKTLSDPSIHKLIYEWQPPTPEGGANISFFLSILIFLASVTYSNYKPNITETILVLGFTWLAWTGQRSIIWYSLVVMPILAQVIGSLPISKLRFITQFNWLNTFLVIILAIPLVLVQPWFVENLPLSEKYWNKVHRNSIEGPLIAVETPIEAAEYLKQNPGGSLFNEMGYGSYLIWAVPEQKVFIDPRIELYPFEQWKDYLDITNCYRYNDHLEKYGANRILLDKLLQPELTTCLASDEMWVLEYQDERSQLWKKK